MTHQALVSSAYRVPRASLHPPLSCRVGVSLRHSLEGRKGTGSEVFMIPAITARRVVRPNAGETATNRGQRQEL